MMSDDARYRLARLIVPIGVGAVTLLGLGMTGCQALADQENAKVKIACLNTGGEITDDGECRKR